VTPRDAVHLKQFFARDLVGGVERQDSVQALTFAFGLFHNSRDHQPGIHIIRIGRKCLLEEFQRFVIFTTVCGIDSGLNKWLHKCAF
jgi:hypothetical protein